MFSFCNPGKHQKTFDFMMFSGGIERDQWYEMGLKYYINELIVVLNVFKVDNKDTKMTSIDIIPVSLPSKYLPAQREQ